MTRQAGLGLGALLLLLLAGLLLLLSPSETACFARTPPDFFQDLPGEWQVTVRMRDTADSNWKEFRTPALIESLFDGRVLRERAPDSARGWRELAFMRWDDREQSVVFEHLFSGSLSMLRMHGPATDETTTVHFMGDWHRQTEEGARLEPASGSLTIESRDRHVWRLDKHPENGNTFVDLEMVYERK